MQEIKYMRREVKRKYPPRDLMFVDDKPKIKRPPSNYSNPQFHIMYGFQDKYEYEKYRK